MSHFWNAVLDVINPLRKSEALYQEVLSNLKRAGAPSRVDVLYSEFLAKVSEANATISRMQ